MLADEHLARYTQAAQRAHKTLFYWPESRCQAVLAKRCLYGMVTESHSAAMSLTKCCITALLTCITHLAIKD